MTDEEKKKYEDKLGAHLSGLKELTADELKKAREYFDTNKPIFAEGAVGNFNPFKQFKRLNSSITLIGVSGKGIDLSAAGVSVSAGVLNGMSTGAGFQGYGLDGKTWGKALAVLGRSLNIEGQDIEAAVRDENVDAVENEDHGVTMRNYVVSVGE